MIRGKANRQKGQYRTEVIEYPEAAGRLIERLIAADAAVGAVLEASSVDMPPP